MDLMLKTFLDNEFILGDDCADDFMRKAGGSWK